MRYLFLILFISPFTVSGQSTLASMSNQAFHGTIHVPSFMELDVKSNNTGIGFSSFEEYFKGKEYPSYFQVKVKSTKPYIVSARAKMPNLMPKSPEGSMDIPSSIFSVRNINNNQFISLTTAAQPVIYSTTNHLVRHYPLDAKVIGPPNARGGDYTLTVLFSITAQ